MSREFLNASIANTREARNSMIAMFPLSLGLIAFAGNILRETLTGSEGNFAVGMGVFVVSLAIGFALFLVKDVVKHHHKLNIMIEQRDSGNTVKVSHHYK